MRRPQRADPAAAVVEFLTAVLICKDGAEKWHNSWYGGWIIRAVLPDGGSGKALVTSRSLFKQREFKTIVGLVSFLADMGCKTASIPLEQGASERHFAPGRTPE